MGVVHVSIMCLSTHPCSAGTTQGKCRSNEWSHNPLNGALAAPCIPLNIKILIFMKNCIRFLFTLYYVHFPEFLLKFQTIFRSIFALAFQSESNG